MLHPHHLSLSRHGLYYFRFPIPLELHPQKKRTDVKLSLGTRCPRMALQIGRALSYAGYELLQRNEIASMDYQQIRQALATYFTQVLERNKQQLDKTGPYSASSLSSLKTTNELATYAAENKDYLFMGTDEQLDIFMGKMNLSISAESPAYEMLRVEYVKALRDYSTKAMSISNSLNSYSFDTASPTPAAITKDPPNTSLTVKQAADAFVLAHSNDSAWNPRTTKERQAFLSLLCELLGEQTQLAAIDKAKAREFRDTVKQLPRNRHKNPAIKNLSLTEAIISDAPRISPATALKFFGTIQKLFEWCSSEGHIDNSPFKSLKITTDRSTRGNPREAFTPDQIQLILRTTANEEKHYRHWGVLIAAYTGARLNEIAQLELNDIKQEDGIWYFDMNDDGDSKQLKTAAAKRKVPIHSELLLNGILEEVERLRSQNKKRFLHELTYCPRNGYGKKLGSYVNTVLLPKLDIKKPTLVFHSFRHTMNTALHRADIPQPIVESLIGHKRSGVSLDTYFAKGYKLSQLRDAIDKFDLSNI